MAKAVLSILPALLLAVPVFARTEGPVPGALADPDSRTCVWSIYGEGGLPWAAGLQYADLNARRSLGLSPALGGGVDFTLRPWVRFGAEYLWSRWRREQRPSALKADGDAFKAYGSRLTDGHSVKLHADFNLTGLRHRTMTRRFNIWAGTGVGCLPGLGHDYSILFSTTQTQGGTTVPVSGDISAGNEGSITFTGKVRSLNEEFKFCSAFIPTVLHFELDLSRRWTAGVKGEADFLLGGGGNAPKQLFSALFTLRFHFVPSRAKVLTCYYKGEIDRLEAELNALLKEQKTIHVGGAEVPEDEALSGGRETIYVGGAAMPDGQEAGALPAGSVGEIFPVGGMQTAGNAVPAGRQMPDGPEAGALPAGSVGEIFPVGGMQTAGSAVPAGRQMPDGRGAEALLP